METGKDEAVFQFFVSFAEPLIANLRNEEEKETTVNWLRKIAASRKSALRIRYLKFLLYILQTGRLMCPFDVEVEVDTELDDMADDVTERDMYNYTVIKSTGRRPTGNVVLPELSTLTEEERNFEAIQVIPSVGVRCYFATSALPMKRWFQPPVMLPVGDEAEEETVGTFEDYIQKETRRRRTARDVQPSASSKISEEYVEQPAAPNAKQSQTRDYTLTTDFPKYYDRSERPLPTTGPSVNVSPQPTRLIPRKREPEYSTDGQLLDVEEPEFEVQPAGRDLIELEDGRDEENWSPKYRRLKRVIKELEDIFPCPETSAPTQQPVDLVCPRHLTKTPPLREIVEEFNDIPTVRPSSTYHDAQPVHCPQERYYEEDDRPIQTSQKRSSNEDKQPTTTPVRHVRSPADVTLPLVNEEQHPISARLSREYKSTEFAADDTPLPADQWSDGEPLQKIIDALLIEPLQLRDMKHDFVDMYKSCRNLPDDYEITWTVRKDLMQFTRQYLFDVFRNSDLPSTRLRGTIGFPSEHDFDNPSYSQNAILRLIVVDNVYSILSTLSVEQLDFFLDFIQEYPFNRPRHLISSEIGQLGSTDNLDRPIVVPDTGGQALPLPRPRRIIVTTTLCPTTAMPRKIKRTTTARTPVMRGQARAAPVTSGMSTARPRITRSPIDVTTSRKTTKPSTRSVRTTNRSRSRINRLKKESSKNRSVDRKLAKNKS